jgi:hypothetical protein
MTLAEKILAADDLGWDAVDAIPEWGVTADDQLSQRGMTGLERRRYEAAFARDEAGQLLNPDADPRSLVVGQTLVDAAGNRVFDDSQVAQLSGKSAAVLDRLCDTALRLSGVEGTRKEAQAARKNSSATDGTDSSIG